MFKLMIFVVLIINFAFAININEANRYELMTYGGLDAGRADMLIKERAKREITNPKDINKIYGFETFNTSKLEENFVIEALPKPEPKKEEKKEPEKIIIEKNNYIRKYYPPQYEQRRKYGDIEIIEKGSYPPYDRYDSRYERDSSYYERDEFYDKNGVYQREKWHRKDNYYQRDRRYDRNRYYKDKYYERNRRYDKDDGLQIDIDGSIRYQKDL